MESQLFLEQIIVSGTFAQNSRGQNVTDYSPEFEYFFNIWL